MIRAAAPLSSFTIRNRPGPGTELYGPAAGLFPYDRAMIESMRKASVSVSRDTALRPAANPISAEPIAAVPGIAESASIGRLS